jgi:multimeric flavodoxin WrbA
MTSENGVDYSDLKALYVNCTLKKSPELSHTQGLIDKSVSLMRAQGVKVDTVRFIDHDVATGIYPDMREHGWQTDAWLDEVWPLVDAADILVVGGPLWLGDNASITRKFIERLYAMSGMFNERGPQQMPAGSVRWGPAPATSTRDRVALRMTSPTATRRS